MRAGLLLKDLAGALTHLVRVLMIGEQLNQYPGQFLFGSNADGIVCTKIVSDGTEICIMRTHDNGHAELRWLEGIVSTGGYKAAADEGDSRD